MLKELHTLQGHSRDVLCADWHPVHEDVRAGPGEGEGRAAPSPCLRQLV
jgi:hypothetical protein